MIPLGGLHGSQCNLADTEGAPNNNGIYQYIQETIVMQVDGLACVKTRFYPPFSLLNVCAMLKAIVVNLFRLLITLDFDNFIYFEFTLQYMEAYF